MVAITVYCIYVSNISKVISACRICKLAALETLIDFGQIALTGVFYDDGKNAEKVSLVLSRCTNCGLVQLGNDYSHNILYGNSYGYESHLNMTMVKHLQSKAQTLERRYLSHVRQPVVVDIASNDGTLLAGYSISNSVKIGIDPLINVLSDYYPKNTKKLNTFFSSSAYWNCHNSNANLVTSLSVLYDLEDPVIFASQIFEILADDGIWHFEQSYLPMMLQTNSYDTICHEHLLYLTLHDIINILNQTGFQLKSVSTNNVNGGSIAVTAIKSKKNYALTPFAEFLLMQEIENRIINGDKIKSFISEFQNHSKNLKDLITKYKRMGFDVVGLGASTKGNSLIQLSGIDNNDVRVIGEVNSRKFSKQTPGSAIPIVPEGNILSNATDKTIAVVFPWHFRENLIEKFHDYLMSGGKLLFPLPQIEVVEV